MAAMDDDPARDGASARRPARLSERILRHPGLKVQASEPVRPQSFDDFELRLGDVMRGERATLDKSLLDVERELRIKASYIAAIENADPSAFPTPGFIPGFVRSYARYLGLDPEWAYEKFCAESGFAGVAGELGRERPAARDPKGANGAGASRLGRAHGAGTVGEFRIFERVERAPLAELSPGALGGLAVVILLLAGIGYGGWAILQEIQRVRITSEDTPVLIELPAGVDGRATAGVETASAGARPDRAIPSEPFAGPAANDPIASPATMVLAGDAPILPSLSYDDMTETPIAEIDPDRVGLLAPLRSGPAGAHSPTSRAAEMALAMGSESLIKPEQGAKESATAEGPAETPPVEIVAAIPAWVRVKSAEGDVLFERILNEGESWTLPQSLEKVVIRAGNGGYLYLRRGDKVYGPIGEGSRLVRDETLDLAKIDTIYPEADNLPVFFSNPEPTMAENR